MAILDVQHLSKLLGGKEILHDICFEIEEGSITGLVGPNGAGKSTLLKTIAGLYHYRKGTITILGKDRHQEFEEAMKEVSAMVETPEFYSHLSGYDNLRIACLYTGKPAEERIQQVSAFVKLTDRIHDKVKTYSLGMKQRLGLAAALLSEPKLLILDEPTNGLDPFGIRDLRHMLKEINEKNKTTILLSSHLLSEVEQICTKILLIDQGKIVENVSVEEIRAREGSLEEEFIKKAVDGAI